MSLRIQEKQVEAAARAWLAWQFPGRKWETAVPAMQDKFREGARVVLRAGLVTGDQGDEEGSDEPELPSVRASGA